MSLQEIDLRLHTACAQGDLVLVKRLLSQGADVNSVNSTDGFDGWSALHYASVIAPVEVAKTLIEAGANLNAQSKKGGCTPLHFAAARASCLDVAIALLNAGADVTLIDAEGRTPFDMSNGRAVREYYESWLAAKAISEAFGARILRLHIAMRYYLMTPWGGSRRKVVSALAWACLQSSC